VPEEIPEPSLTDLTDTSPAQGKPRCITLILLSHYIYIYSVCVCVLREFNDTHMYIYLPMSLTSVEPCSRFAYVYW
jgi:hypothetical protein